MISLFQLEKAIKHLELGDCRLAEFGFSKRPGTDVETRVITGYKDQASVGKTLYFDENLKDIHVATSQRI